MVADLDDVTNLRAASPAGSICRGSQCSQVSSRNKLVLIPPAVKKNKHSCSSRHFIPSGDPPEVCEHGGSAAGGVIEQGAIKNHSE